MTTAREVLQLIITGDGKGAVAEMKRVGAAAKTELGAAERSAASMSTTMVAGGAAVAAAGAGVLFGLKQTSDAYITAGRETMKLQRLTGGAAEDMSRLRYVAEMTGVGVDALGTSVIRLSKSSQGSSGRTALQDLGVDMEDAQGKARPVVDVLADIAGRFEAMPNGIEKNATALKLFGRSGADLIPLLNRGSAGISDLVAQADKLGLTLTEDDLGKVKEYTMAQRELAQAREALMMQVGQEVFPIFADGLEKASTIVSGISSEFSDLPGPIKSGAGALLSYGSAAAVAAGGVAFLSGMTAKLNTNLRTSTGTLNMAGKAAGTFSIAIAAYAAGSLGLKMLDDSATGVADSVAEMQAALAAGGDARFAELVTSSLREIDNRADSAGDKVRAFFSITNIGGDNRSLQAVRKDLEELARVDPSGAERLLNAIVASAEADPDMFPDDRSRQAWEDVVGGVRRYIETQRLAAAATEESSSATSSSIGANSGAAASLDRLAYSYERTGDAAEGAAPGATAYAEAVRGAFDPVLALADANDALEDAQTRMAEAAETNGKDVRDAQRGVADAYRSVEDAQRSLDDSRRRVLDATRDLSDAQRELNEVLADDPMFGLTSVSPEEEIADARSRLAEANRRLAANPGDGFALAMRDEALMDMERAVQRRQDMARDGEQRAEEIERAQRALEDAQRGLSDAQRGVGDAERGVGDARQRLADAQAQLAEVNAQHGLNSEEYQRAALDVIRATLDVQDADATLAQYLKDNGITAVGDIITKLDEWIARGGPVGEAAARMKANLQPLVEQALVWAAALQQVNVQLPSTAEWAAQWDALFGGYNDKPNSGGKPRRIIGINPSTGSPIYEGGAATGGLIRGAGSGTSDSIPMMLSNGEYVLRADAVARLGVPALDELNATGRLPMRVPSSRLPSLPAAGRSSGGGGASVAVDNRSSSDAGVTIDVGGVQVVTREPVLAGAAVVGELRQIAHRSGRGLAVSERIR